MPIRNRFAYDRAVLRNESRPSTWDEQMLRQNYHGWQSALQNAKASHGETKDWYLEQAELYRQSCEHYDAANGGGI